MDLKKTMLRKQGRSVLLLVMAICLCIPCTAKDTKRIERNMTKDEVAEILGTPITTSFDENTETWQYNKIRGSLFNRSDVYITVVFSNSGRVVQYREESTDVTPPPVSGMSTPPAHFSDRYGCAMTEANFTLLRNKIRKAGLTSTRLDLIEVAALGAFFTCRQCADLMSDMSFSSDKFKALQLLAPRITDARNAEVIYQQFSFSADKDKAAAIVSQAQQ